MRTLIAFAFLGLVIGMIPIATGTASPTRDEQIQATIRAQLDRFNQDDAAGAFSYASPNIQRHFKTADRFADMVRRGYPQIFKSRTAEFLDIMAAHGRLMQRVRVRGADGREVTAAYAMIEVGGRWLIDGCWIVQRAPQTEV